VSNRQLPNIFERPDRPGIFRAFIELPRGPDGKRRRQPVDGTSMRAVHEDLIRRLRAKQLGTLEHDRGETVGEYLGHWLERRDPFTKQQGLKKFQYTAWSNHASKIRLHIVPLLGKRTLRELTGDDVAWMIERLYEKGLSPTTVGDVRNLLVAALNRAIKDRTHGLTHNAAATTDAIPRSTPSVDEFYALDQAEADRFVAAAAGDEYEAVYELALTAGLRESEVLGMMWDSIDLERRELTVRRKLARVKGKGLMTFAPKSAHSAATLPLTDTAVTLLRTHYRAELEKMLASGDAWKGGDLRRKLGYVFTTDIGTPISASNFLRRQFRPLCDRAGIPTGVQKDGSLGLRFHDLRHSCASIMAARGERVEVIQRVMRHANPNFTLKRYVKVFGTDLRAAVDRQDRAANTASKGFANAIGRLRSLGFIDYPERGKVVAQPVLFLEDRVR